MKRKIILVISILIVFNIFLFISPTNKYINSIYTNINNALSTAAEGIKSSIVSRNSTKILENKVEELEKKKSDLEIKNNKLEKEKATLEDNNKDLERIANISKEKTNVIISNILYKKLNSRFNIFLIDKGSKDKVQLDQLVTYNGQIVGYISKVDKETSEVMLLKNDNIKFNIPVKIKTVKGDVDAVIESYSYMNNKIVITTLLDSSQILEGDKVYTNGYNKNQVADIYVGEISKINSDEFRKEYFITPSNESMNYVEVNINED